MYLELIEVLSGLYYKFYVQGAGIEIKVTAKDLEDAKTKVNILLKHGFGEGIHFVLDGWDE